MKGQTLTEHPCRPGSGAVCRVGSPLIESLPTRKLQGISWTVLVTNLTRKRNEFLSKSICSRTTLVYAATRLQTERLRKRDSIPGRDNRFISLHRVQTASVVHAASLWCCFPDRRNWGVEVTRDLTLMQRTRIREAISPRSHSYMA